MTTSLHNLKVQALRALAIIAVVAIHTCPGDMYQVMFRPFVNFGVGLFLFLSGWLTKAGCADWKHLCRRRIIRVMIPYVLWTIIYSLQKGTPDKIFFNLLTTRASSALYYIFVYVQFVILTPLLVRLAGSRFRWAGFMVAPVSVLLCVYVPLAFGLDCGEIGELAWNVCFLGWFSFYYLGLVLGNGLMPCPVGPFCESGDLSDSRKSRRMRTSFLWLQLAVSVCLQILEGYLWLRHGWPNCGSQLKLSSLLTTVSVLLLSHAYLTDSRLTSSRVLAGIGDLSFGIYLIHIPVLRTFQNTPWYGYLPYGVNTLLVFAVTLIAVALLSRLSRLISPRLPVLLGLK